MPNAQVTCFVESHVYFSVFYLKDKKKSLITNLVIVTSSLRHFFFVGSFFLFLFVRLCALFFSCLFLRVLVFTFSFLCMWWYLEGPLHVKGFVPLLTVRLMCLLLCVFSCLVDAPHFLSSHSGCGLFLTLWAALLTSLTLTVSFALFLALMPNIYSLLLWPSNPSQSFLHLQSPHSFKLMLASARISFNNACALYAECFSWLLTVCRNVRLLLLCCPSIYLSSDIPSIFFAA